MINLLKAIRLVLCNEIPIKFWFKVKFPHPIGIVISKDVEIGENCRIWSNVAIGKRKYGATKAPKIGNNCMIYSGAVVISDIPDNTIVGANKIV